MNIKEIIQQLRVTMDDAKGQDSHFDSWLTQNEGICKAIDALKILDTQPLPVQEPVACRFCHSKKGCWTWQCYHCGEIDDVQQPALPLPVQEPLEYWNAVEGWVKIDEVREHFDAVNCGTIYKHGGEGRVPLYTAPPQREWVGLTEDEKFEMAAAQYGWEDLLIAAEAKLKEKNK